jgi:hypothetical protein
VSHLPQDGLSAKSISRVAPTSPDVEKLLSSSKTSNDTIDSQKREDSNQINSEKPSERSLITKKIPKKFNAVAPEFSVNDPTIGLDQFEIEGRDRIKELLKKKITHFDLNLQGTVLTPPSEK